MQRYSTNSEQSASLINNCAADHESSDVCVNNNPQAQGKDNNIDTQITTPPRAQGPQGPPGPAGDSRQTIVRLHDDAEGNAVGWNPGEINPENGQPVNNFFILPPFKIDQGMSFEFTFMNPVESPDQNGFVEATNCDPVRFVPATNLFLVSCSPPLEGAILTYVMTQ